MNDVRSLENDGDELRKLVLGQILPWHMNKMRVILVRPLNCGFIDVIEAILLVCECRRVRMGQWGLLPPVKAEPLRAAMQRKAELLVLLQRIIAFLRLAGPTTRHIFAKEPTTRVFFATGPTTRVFFATGPTTQRFFASRPTTQRLFAWASPCPHPTRR